MPKWMDIGFWVALVVLLDAVIGLLGLKYWERLAPKLNVKWIALVELAASLAFLIVYFSKRMGG